MNNSLFRESMAWHYQSFMLRLWREAPDAPYRASLQATTDGEQIIFADLPALFTFLETIDAARSSQTGNPPLKR